MKKLLSSTLITLCCLMLLAQGLQANLNYVLEASTLPNDPSKFDYPTFGGGTRNACSVASAYLRWFKKLKKEAVKWKEKKIKGSKHYADGGMKPFKTGNLPMEKRDCKIIDEIITKIDTYINFLTAKKSACMSVNRGLGK